MTKKWWNNFLTGVIGTAIGVGLTFAINGIMTNHWKAESKRQTALMAVYDIDQIVKQIETHREREDAFFKVSMYMSTHQEEIETVSTDTLVMLLSYLVDEQSVSYDFANDSKERAFTSSMEALQNLGNIMFYDNVQACYQTRRELLNKMAKDFSFKRPVSEESYYKWIKEMGDDALGINGWLSEKALRALAKHAVQNQGLPYFFHKYFYRDRVYQETINYLMGINQENKLLMEITDEDMEEYIRNNVDKTKPATLKLIAGQWENQQDKQKQTYLLNRDNTATMTSHIETNLSFVVEEEKVTVSVVAPVTFTINGQWKLEEDSLFLSFDPETTNITDFDLDLSSLPKAALEREKDSIDIKTKQYEQYILQQIKAGQWTLAYKVSMAKMGDIMFWEREYPLPWGQTETYKDQLVKIR